VTYNTPYPPSGSAQNANVVFYINTMPKRSIYPISYTLAFGASDTTHNFTLETYGLVHSLLLNLPNFSNSVTATITITDGAGNIVYTQSGIAVNQEAIFGSTEFQAGLAGINTITVTLSGAPGGSGGNVGIEIRLKGGPEW
jgi:hypothetical protein